MKCKDCTTLCNHRSSDGEKECFYSQPQPDVAVLKTYNQINEEKHWEDVRERAAIAALGGLLADSACDSSTESMVKCAIEFANELVRQLKGK